MDLANSPLESVALLALLSALPFAFMTLTSFLKISVVFSILKTALGAQVPSNMVVSALSGVLTLYVMAPVFSRMEVALAPVIASTTQGSDAHAGTAAEHRGTVLIDGVVAASVPLTQWMATHASRREVQGFLSLRQRNVPTALASDFLVVAPAFVVSELSRGFQIGFLVYLPFLVIDIVIANILMALGMHMLSPTTISMPFKLMLFVLVDGWHLLSRALVLGY